MQLIRLIANILWFILGGFIAGTAYMLLALLFCATIIGIPIGKALFQYGKLMYLPFGKVIVRETFIKGAENVSVVRKIGGLVLNIIWLPIGVLMFLGNMAVIILNVISIIGIPSAIVVAKASVFLLWPIGAKVITKEEQHALMSRPS